MKAPLDELMQEHQVILRMLDVFEAMRARVQSTGASVPGDWEAVVDFLVNFADHNHHGKEEEILFPAMEKAGLPRQAGPIGVMLMEHRQGRELVAELRRATTRAKAGEAGAVTELLAAAGAYTALLRAHIEKEDHCLYPMAENLMPENCWLELSRAFARVEQERMGPARRSAYEALIDRLSGVYQSALSGA